MCVSISKLNRKASLLSLGLHDNKHYSGYPFQTCYFGGRLGLGHNQSVSQPLFENLGLNWHSVALVFTCHLLTFLWQMYQGRVCGSRFLTYRVILQRPAAQMKTRLALYNQYCKPSDATSKISQEHHCFCFQLDELAHFKIATGR